MARVEPTGWVGWVYFASAMMILAGGLQAIAGLAALFKEDYFLVTKNGLLAFNFDTWGWIHIALGVLIFLAGLAVMAGSMWGRVVGVILAVLSTMAHLSFLSAYPIWSIIAVTINVFVIYALTMHGDEVKG